MTRALVLVMLVMMAGCGAQDDARGVDACAQDAQDGAGGDAPVYPGQEVEGCAAPALPACEVRGACAWCALEGDRALALYREGECGWLALYTAPGEDLEAPWALCEEGL